ncbi:MAG: hypothetical protein MPEBLZ_02320 [Candidatus Methanoperedens nitroreducens]|uniref:DUF424 domain-containing protein n=2 Tax=Candidatus Methanoperedens TaxID=1392997 RepID=A0A0P7ZHB5_9EURY|nr:MAG: DUF424 family protein [Candidatus Methanoperedens sp.]KPQ43096.1 MAG: hypothetical protein MPEBLZ_02320 [Candidatus Methanoperedens sp. BLZ1]MBZ0175507.1 DUF424 family protein [Candidatus Methanoperedens nitroreducens]CAG0981518.1 hypothetical protein METP2_02004 [Methanosarcinales archaeon]
MYMKRYDTDGKLIVAVCDTDILGKKFKEGKLVLKLEESFYKGEEVCENEVKEALSCANIANIAGKRSIACAVECGCVDPDTVIFIDGIPHAQMVEI